MEEVADRLGVSREAAKQRVFRAIEKLRNRLAGKGAIVSATGLSALMTAHAVEAAPAGLAISAAATGAITTGSAAWGIAQGAAKIMAYLKLKAALVAAVIVVT